MSSDGSHVSGVCPYLYSIGPSEDQAKARFEKAYESMRAQGFMVFADPRQDVSDITSKSEAVHRGIIPVSPPQRRGVYIERLCEWQWGWLESVWVLKDE
ncbi:MAG: hypothetical protein R6X02_13905 [Enhygromyxa sp.]